MEDATLRLLHAARAAEREQAAFYRGLAAASSRGGDVALEERLNELHADEQHHLSRLSARLLELGQPLEPLDGGTAGETPLQGWEAAARSREEAEVERYAELLARGLDEESRDLVRQILETERHHRDELGGKWTKA